MVLAEELGIPVDEVNHHLETADDHLTSDAHHEEFDALNVQHRGDAGVRQPAGRAA